MSCLWFVCWARFVFFDCLVLFVFGLWLVVGCSLLVGLVLAVCFCFVLEDRCLLLLFVCCLLFVIVVACCLLSSVCNALLVA